MRFFRSRKGPTEGTPIAGPSMLELIRLSPEPVFPPGGEALYRQIALLTDMEEGHEVLDVACGRGVSTTFMVASYGVDADGIDSNADWIDEAEQRARGSAFEHRLHFQAAPVDDLPYRDGIFDICIGEFGLAASADPAGAVRELVRVTKPMGCVVLVQLVWTGNLDEERREILVDYLGVRPMLLVEWKQMLRDAGVVELHVEDWTDQAGSLRPRAGTPFPDFAELFSLRDKARILNRALRRWGWRAVRGAILREQEVHRLLTRERVLGLTLIKGVRWDANAGS